MYTNFNNFQQNVTCWFQKVISYKEVVAFFQLVLSIIWNEAQQVVKLVKGETILEQTLCNGIRMARLNPLRAFNDPLTFTQNLLSLYRTFSLHQNLNVKPAIFVVMWQTISQCLFTFPECIYQSPYTSFYKAATSLAFWQSVASSLSQHHEISYILYALHSLFAYRFVFFYGSSVRYITLATVLVSIAVMSKSMCRRR